VFFGIQNEREWLKFCEIVLEAPEVAGDPRFAGNAKRVDNRPALHERIDSELSQLTLSAVLERLERAEIANAELRDMKTFSAHPQLEARKRWRDVDSPAGPLRSLLPPVTSRSIEYDMGPVPGLGQHTAAVLKELSEAE
jgi:crotonobetainyl-CoA:carnitine CoA-transferase CaiB-like acyl-CoA transferase